MITRGEAPAADPIRDKPNKEPEETTKVLSGSFRNITSLLSTYVWLFEPGRHLAVEPG